MNKYFYCYSIRLEKFLYLFGQKYISCEIHPKTKKRFYKYNKSEELDFLLKKWDEIKQEIELSETIKK